MSIHRPKEFCYSELQMMSGQIEIRISWEFRKGVNLLMKFLLVYTEMGLAGQGNP